jgi:predicted metal-binding membrane protein
VFVGVAGLLFLGSAAVTISWCASMSIGMPMPGGWTMSMAWMRMPGQSWLGAAIDFIEMWAVMMVAMMLPPLVPMLSGYRRSVREVGEARLGMLTVINGVGYFLVWIAYGAVTYPLGMLAAVAEMRSPTLARIVPMASGIALFLAGWVQLTAWKARQLRHCRDAAGCGPLLSPDPQTAWRKGVRLGVHCSLCCSSYIVVLLVAGVMDLRAMGAVGTAIAAERLVPWPEQVARIAGGAMLVLGVWVIGGAWAGARP